MMSNLNRFNPMDTIMGEQAMPIGINRGISANTVETASDCIERANQYSLQVTEKLLNLESKLSSILTFIEPNPEGKGSGMANQKPEIAVPHGIKPKLYCLIDGISSGKGKIDRLEYLVLCISDLLGVPGNTRVMDSMDMGMATPTGMNLCDLHSKESVLTSSDVNNIANFVRKEIMNAMPRPKSKAKAKAKGRTRTKQATTKATRKTAAKRTKKKAA